MRRRYSGGLVLGLCLAMAIAATAQEAGKSQPKKSVPKGAAAAEVKAPPVETKKSAPPGKPSEVKPAAKLQPAGESAVSTKAIRTEGAALIAAYNAKDAKALAEQFLADAEYELDSGEVLHGRDAIRGHFEAHFAESPDARASFTLDRIRFVTPTMAVVEGTVSAIVTEAEPESQSPCLAIRTLHEGRWLLASIRELPEKAELPGPHQHLEVLSWLVGDWVDESHHSLVASSYRWSEDGNFLLHDFQAHLHGSEILSGTQRIGWDPLTRKIKAWVFDSTGGYGESLWTWDGKSWLIHATGVRPDGTTASATNSLTPLTDHSFRFDSINRVAGNEVLPDLSLRIARKAPAPDESADEDEKMDEDADAKQTDEDSDEQNGREE